MYQSLSQSREISTKNRIHPPTSKTLRRVPEIETPEHALLTFQYYETLSKPRSEIFSKRIGNENSHASAQMKPIDAPDVVRAATPYSFPLQGRTPSRASASSSQRLRLPPVDNLSQVESERLLSESNAAYEPDQSFVGLPPFQKSTHRASLVAQSQLKPKEGSGDHLVCFVGDRPLSYYTSPLRRGPGRMRSAGALALQLKGNISGDTPQIVLTQAEIEEEKNRVVDQQDTLHRLNRLLRSSSGVR